MVGFFLIIFYGIALFLQLDTPSIFYHYNLINEFFGSPFIPLGYDYEFYDSFLLRLGLCFTVVLFDQDFTVCCDLFFLYILWYFLNISLEVFIVIDQSIHFSLCFFVSFVVFLFYDMLLSY